MFAWSRALQSYFPRARWYPWRQQQVRERNERARHNRTAGPSRFARPGTPEIRAFSFKVTDVALSLKKLQRYSELLRRRHLQDALDWLEAATRPSARPLQRLLERTRRVLVEERRLDAARLFLDAAVGERGRYERRVNLTRDGGTKIRRHVSNRFRVVVREMPLPEFFHRVYIEKRVPRCIVLDMQNALREGRAEGRTALGFLPYLTSDTRRTHRRRLKLLQSQKLWNYAQARDAWIHKYTANVARHENAHRQARGLLPSLDAKAPAVVVDK